MSTTQSLSNQRLDAWIRARQTNQRLAVAPRIERINVAYGGYLSSESERILQMTKGVSAPIDCARHISELLVRQSVLALVNGEPWDMHRPLLEDCEVDFVQFKDAHHDPTPANNAFWRSACFLLAATLEASFRPEHQIRLISNPPLNPETGGFVCDISFTLFNSEDIWIPSEQELRALSAEGQRIAAADHPFEPLFANTELIELCFGSEPLRLQQILRFASPDSQTGNVKFPIYRMGSFVEASLGGPLITSTSLIGRFAVTSFRPLGWLQGYHPTENRVGSRVVYRVQGVALPTAFLTHFTTFERLMQWSRAPNTAARLSDPDYVVAF